MVFLREVDSNWKSKWRKPDMKPLFENLAREKRRHCARDAVKKCRSAKKAAEVLRVNLKTIYDY
jgi:hypothetical protein